MKKYLLAFVLLIPSSLFADTVNFTFAASSAGLNAPYNTVTGFDSSFVVGSFGYQWQPNTFLAQGTFSATVGSQSDTEPALFRWAAPLQIEDGLWIIGTSSFKGMAADLWLLAPWSPECGSDRCPSLPDGGYAPAIGEMVQFGSAAGQIDPLAWPTPNRPYLNAAIISLVDPPPSIPEPATWLTLLSGLGMIVILERRKRV